jgi:hypothetical protein
MMHVLIDTQFAEKNRRGALTCVKHLGIATEQCANGEDSINTGIDQHYESWRVDGSGSACTCTQPFKLDAPGRRPNAAGL